MDEEWKEIPYFEGIYEASTWGRIRTVEGKVTIRSDGLKRVWKQRILKLKKQQRHGHDEKSDYIVTLYKNGNPNYFLVSRLIASTFIENNLYSDLTVNHIDGNPLNNNVSNLEWKTRKDNILYGFQEDQFTNVTKSIDLIHESNIFHFKSLAEANRFLKRCDGYVRMRIHRRYNTLVSADGVEYSILKVG